MRDPVAIKYCGYCFSVHNSAPYFYIVFKRFLDMLILSSIFLIVKRFLDTFSSIFLTVAHVLKSQQFSHVIPGQDPRRAAGRAFLILVSCFPGCAADRPGGGRRAAGPGGVSGLSIREK